jgi:hypothetical protein
MKESQPADPPWPADHARVARRPEPEVRGCLAAPVCLHHGRLDPSWALCPHCLRGSGARSGTVAVATKPRSGVAPTLSVRVRTPLSLLVVRRGEPQGCTYRVSDDFTGIGRDPHNYLVLQDPGVSRFHARIVRRRNALLISDLGSTNGTFVNGERLRPQSAFPLAEGDEVRMGATILELKLMAGRQAPS